MDSERVAALREMLRHTPWWAQARTLAAVVRRTSGPGRLLLVGTPRVEPWHLAAHLDDEARVNGQPQLSPQLVRWRPPVGAPAHLSIAMTRLEAVTRGETVFVVAPDDAPDHLLERVDAARRVGATVLSLDAGDERLGDLAHERMTVTSSGLAIPEALATTLEPVQEEDRGVPRDVLAGLHLPASFDLAQHFVSAASGQDPGDQAGWRCRLAGLLTTISGPGPQHGSPQRGPTRRAR